MTTKKPLGHATITYQASWLATRLVSATYPALIPKSQTHFLPYATAYTRALARSPPETSIIIAQNIYLMQIFTETGSPDVAQPGFKFLILLLQLPESCDYSQGPPQPVFKIT